MMRRSRIRRCCRRRTTATTSSSRRRRPCAKRVIRWPLRSSSFRTSMTRPARRSHATTCRCARATPITLHRYRRFGSASERRGGSGYAGTRPTLPLNRRCGPGAALGGPGGGQSMRLLLATVIGALVLASAPPARAQDHQHEPAAPPPQAAAGEQQHDHAAMMAGPTLFPAREASGTAWLPETTPMYGLHGRAGAWELMGHGNVFAQFLYEAAAEHRGSAQAGSINWVMGMARRNIGAGRFGLRAMLSLEPVTVPGCGYPDLLATGESCDGDSIHDRQHPHDLFMELAAEYERPLRGSLRWQVYAGLAGEPALGPVAFPHRLSAMPNPLAPTGHHWLDATHITFGVVTGAVFAPRWKAEMSVFNGREPDENRWDLDFAPLDSVSGRFSFAPSPGLVLQISAGHLTEAEAAHGAAPRVDVDRVTASATYHR